MTEAKQKLIPAVEKPAPAPATAGGLGALLAQPLMACLLLAGATLLVYWPVQGFDFVSLDDPSYYTANPHLRLGLSWAGFKWALTTRYFAMWLPLTYLSFLADAQLFGLDPTGPHLINLLLHTGSTVVLFLLLRRATGAHYRSLFVAALFALHPLHVESVAWVSERKDVLSAFFGLLTLWAYIAYAQARLAPGPAERARSRRFYVLALLCYALSLLSKPMFVTLPCVFLLCDYWPLGRWTGTREPEGRNRQSDSPFSLQPLAFSLLREKLPFFILAAVTCILTVWAAQGGQTMQPLSDLPGGLRVENAFVSYVRYLGKTFWPSALSLPYPRAPHWSALTVIGAAALVLGLCAAAALGRRQRPFVAMGWFWFFGTLIPVIGLAQAGEQAMADRYSYLPSIGFYIALTWAAAEVLHRRRLHTFAAALALALVCACALRTRDQLRYWQNSETLFTHSLAVTEKNWLAAFALGCHYSGTGHTDEAIKLYQYARDIMPQSTEVLNNLGNAYAAKERYADAFQCFDSALDLKPDNADYHSNYGAALDKAGRAQEAIAAFTRALQLAPDSALTHYRLANTLAKLHQNDEAIAHYRLAVHYRPDYTQAINNLAVALFNQGKIDEAIEQFSTALTQTPEDVNTRCNLANALAVQHRWTEAAQQYAEAARLQPDLVPARFGLAQALLQLARKDDAVEQLNTILQLSPNNAAAKKQLEALQGPATK